jgi:hypothetical protein
MIKLMKKAGDPTIIGPSPERTMKILHDTKNLRGFEKKVIHKKEKNNRFGMLGFLGRRDEDGSKLDESMKKEIGKTPGLELNSPDPREGNEKLNTPSMKRLAQVTDGSTALKDEITESMLRMKAAKHGSRVKKLVPDHPIDFYLPERP